jgi:hypothetical protein
LLKWWNWKKKQLQKNSKEKIEVKRMVIKFERKQLKGYIILDWRAKLKKKNKFHKTNHKKNEDQI